MKQMPAVATADSRIPLLSFAAKADASKKNPLTSNGARDFMYGVKKL
jgi:hypothetical protein